jgi:hypothetical protein
MITPDKQAKRDKILEYFRNVARQELAKQNPIPFDALFNEEDRGKIILFIMPESIGDVFLCTALLKSLKETYPWCKLYFATKPEYFEIFDGNTLVDKVIPYTPQMDNHFFLTGAGNNKGYVEIAFHPYFGTQRLIDYCQNGKDKIAFDIQGVET